MTTPDLPLNLTPEEVADRLRVKVDTLYHWKLRRMGPKWFKAGRRLRYRLADVEAYERAEGLA